MMVTSRWFECSNPAKRLEGDNHWNNISMQTASIFATSLLVIKENLTVLFVMGLGAQMVAWPESLITGLVDAGFHVLCYDNRDVGLSQKFDSAGMPDFESLVADLVAGKKSVSPYYLSDMAAGGIGLMDALEISQAHVVGASMGGMIAQQVAIESPE